MKGPTWPKCKSILNTHPISVHTKFEFDCMNTFSDNGRKPSFSVILGPLEGQNLANMAQKRITVTSEPWVPNIHPISVHTKFELDCVNTFSDNGQKPQIFSYVVATRWPKFSQRDPNANQF